jgi:hypothetical protein
MALFGSGRWGSSRRALYGGGLLAIAGLLSACGGGGGGGDSMSLSVLSSRPEWVSAGDTLLKVNRGGDADQLKLFVNGTAVPADFRTDPDDGKPVVLVSGLAEGDNDIRVESNRVARGTQSATVRVTNHPRTGPMFSGPWETPYICQTDTFQLYPGGPMLGAATDANCSAATRVDYIYRTTADTWAALPSMTAVPTDAATVTIDGRNVPLIVRLETGTLNRAIYQTAVLHNPATGNTPSPTQRASGWNGKLVYTFGGGCTTGWYRQGNSTGGVLDVNILKKGYALASSSLNVFGNNCQDVTPAETMSMVKERFIETYGKPRYTIGWGCSGGSYQQHQIGDNYPGLLDGILPGCSFPEVLFGTVYAITDMRLLGNYFLHTAPGTFTDEQQRQVAGIQNVETMYTDTVYNGAMRIAPGEFVPLDQATRTLGGTRTYCPGVLPVSQRYDPATNPGGARCDVYDHAINSLGRDPATGFAYRPLDNVGVQYGLAALNAGTITVDQFLDLNAGVGGYGVDANFQASRTVARTEAVRAAYRSGRLTNGGGGLRDLPIIDYRAYADDRASGDIHLRFHSFAMRDRLIQANGDADNQVMLVEDFRYGYYSSDSPLLMHALDEMDKWIAAIQADRGRGSQHDKVVRNKPATLQEGCNTRDATPTFIAETQQRTSGQCAALYPAPPAPRSVAGAPVAGNVIKCTLKNVDTSDYAVAFTPAQVTRLNTVFPDGVCNYAVPGVEQQDPAGTWQSF